MSSASPTNPTAVPAPVDMLAVLADFQAQLNALNQAITAQQATIDALVDMVIDQLKDHSDAGQ